MSLSWRDACCVSLAPDRLAAIRRRPWRRRVDPGFSEAFTAQPGMPPWAAAVESLDRFLQRPAMSRASLDIVLSNHFVRYCLVPRDARIVNAEELVNYAHASFEHVFGDVSEGWEVCVSPAPPGSPRLAAAMDRGLLESIRAAAGRSRSRLRSVQPYLMAAYNRLAARLRAKDFVFMLAEPDRACVLTAEGGAWRHASSVSLPDDPAALAALLERELRMGEWAAAEPSILVHCAHRPGLALPPHLAGTLRVLELGKRAGLAANEPAFGMVAAIV